MIFIIYSITTCFKLVIVSYTNVTAPLSKALLVLRRGVRCDTYIVQCCSSSSPVGGDANIMTA